MGKFRLGLNLSRDECCTVLSSAGRMLVWNQILILLLLSHLLLVLLLLLILLLCILLLFLALALLLLLLPDLVASSVRAVSYTHLTLPTIYSV